MTRLGELFVIIVRFVGEDLGIKQRVLSLRTIAKSLNSKQMAGEIVNELSRQLRISGEELDRIVCATHDRASVNSAAIRELVCVSACAYGCVCVRVCSIIMLQLCIPNQCWKEACVFIFML